MAEDDPVELVLAVAETDPVALLLAVAETDPVALEEELVLLLADTEDVDEAEADMLADTEEDAETDAEEVAEGDAESETTGSHGEPLSNHWYSSTALWCPLGVVQISVAGVHAGCAP